MSDERSFPDISFVEADLLDTDKVVEEMIARQEQLTGQTIYPASPYHLLTLWAAPIVIQLRALINDSAKQNVPRYARAEKLDSLGELFKGVVRFEARKASTVLRFTIAEVLASPQLVPAGTRVSTLDGGVTFATTDDASVQTGDLTVDVNAECLTAGEAGNGFVSGQLIGLVDWFPHASSVTNTATSAGGTEVETDDEYYARMRASQDAFNTAGAKDAYEYLAMSARADVADAAAVSDAGTAAVTVYVLMDGGTLPDAEAITDITAALSSKDARPLTDSVTVSAPTPVAYNINFTYYVSADSPVPVSVVEANVAAAVAAYKAWQSAKMGRDVNPDELISLVKAAGAKRLVITSPTYAAVAETEVAQLGTESVTDGGVEVG